MSKETSLVALDNCFTDFSDLIQGFSEDDWGFSHYALIGTFVVL